jgi:hypothetical protein
MFIIIIIIIIIKILKHPGMGGKSFEKPSNPQSHAAFQDQRPWHDALRLLLPCRTHLISAYLA